ncbi:MAG: site-2 protease family protein, partial [Oscillospiraceae bacterium]|nr:site-2 protease family protein [Oscillospiraceae bacterium]
VGGKVSVNDLSGPVGIVDMMAETGEQAESVSDGLYNIFYLGAFIAVNLAVMNMLPIPALDGGRVFLLLITALIEAITRKKLDPKYEGYIHAAGMILLLGLMAYVMFHDIFRIVTKT